ncbi:Spp1p SKDI_16G1370 [Saccharomyces kudriavzevii IFO 1802]|uniref:PHD-type domain-containing protein n=1 Tax=Saccharomyces kudriavzevii (strain ATCC MYA-4449 / AS 2.2408 / CBS 8840 / NBRC 1802 / NCYC 2889) TaxID=226230 RepID=A0AA35J8W7_SACK1|nr:uncharacterized protein SKDI_16G1370 [Saccharomyces kudriavzevii IFO 1802]CAI4053127.1 hypothetical protein SKDI_16G1370 [Saccharomyces kudriavzevii IFO 1802]
MSLPQWCPPHSNVKINSTTGEDVYCICKKPDYGELMVGCDGCDDWFHFACLHIPGQFKDLVFSFFCPYCQAGITGKNKDAIINGEMSLPKTLWKRKCRISDCYRPCLPDSKYCSEEHGKEFVNDIWTRLKTDEDRATVKQMVQQTEHIDKFKKFGQLDFINNDIVLKNDEEKKTFDQIVVQDPTLMALENDLQEIQEKTLPSFKKKLKLIEVYLGWLDNVYSEILKLDNDIETNGEGDKADTKGTKKRKKKNSDRGRPRRNICGYSPTYESLPCSVEEFVLEMGNNGETTTIRGVCTKLKCNRHLDWVSTNQEQYLQQIDSLESMQERLHHLIQARKKQLNIQYFEQLSRKGV